MWELLDWASQIWSIAETANRLCLMGQSRQHIVALEKGSEVVSSLRWRNAGNNEQCSEIERNIS